MVAECIQLQQHVKAKDFIVNENCDENNAWEITITKVVGYTGKIEYVFTIFRLILWDKY